MGLLNSLLTLPTSPKLATAMAKAKARASDPSDFITTIAPLPPEQFGHLLGVTLCHDYVPSVPSYQEFLGIEQRLKAVAPHIGWTEGRLELGRCVGIPGHSAPDRWHTSAARRHMPGTDDDVTESWLHANPTRGILVRAPAREMVGRQR